MSISPRLVLQSIGLLLAPLAAADGVIVADGSGGPIHASIQAAVDAAAAGDVVVVGAGTYAGFAVEGKGLTVQALPGHLVEIEGSVVVRDLPAGATVVLSGLRATGASVPFLADPGLLVEDCAGFVRVQDCAFVGGEGEGECEEPRAGGAGASVVDSPRVSFARCELRGGRGDWHLGSSCFVCYGGDGGAGLAATGSVVSVHDSTLVGGPGGEDGAQGGDGGDGARISGFGIYASGSDFRGGDGADACDFIFPLGGNGGDGLVLDGSQARVVDCTFAGGGFGEGDLGLDGQPGVPTVGPLMFFLPGVARSTYGPTATADGETASLGFRGAPGDRVYLLVSDAPAFQFDAEASGVRLVAAGAGTALPLGVVPASGFLPIALKVPALAPGTPSGSLHVQALARSATGELFLGNALDMAVLARAAAPDCDGDGRNDLLALGEGLASDCDGNLLPDSCDLAGGAPDCNSNGVPDACDLELGTSDDVDGNGVPDECQAIFATWHVDASVPPGGDGTPGNPFRTIAAGVAAASNGDTVLVADGTYVGTGNRGVSIWNREIRVVSANGPAACVIDCQGADRAFVVGGAAGPHTRIEGFTIRNGSTGGSGGAIDVDFLAGRLTVASCVFEDCAATNLGGAIDLGSAPARVVDCEFRGNSASHGGAVGAQSADLRVEGCTFVDNVASVRGGGMYVSSPYSDRPAVVSRCTFLENEAADGGGLYYRSGGLLSTIEPPLWLGESLFAGNLATRGGGVFVDGVGPFGLTELWIAGSTFVDNEATSRGGALAVALEAQVLVADSILWGNAAPTGPSIDVQGDEADLTVRFCDLEGGAGSIAPGTGAVWLGHGLLDADPLFVDPDGADDDPATFADNDYRLGALSPCLDAAETRTLLPDALDLDADGARAERVPFDLDGAPRLVDAPSAADAGAGAPPLADLGAYERP